jgi:hypothetical protein
MSLLPFSDLTLEPILNMKNSDSSSKPSSRSAKANIPWFNQPVKLKRIDQLSSDSVKGNSSFSNKGDPLHAYILHLFCKDSITDMTVAGRRGLANNIHLLILRDMGGAVDTGRFTQDGSQVIYQFDTLKKCHRVKCEISVHLAVGGRIADKSLSIAGGWADHQAQALDGLRKTAEDLIHGTG